MTFQHPTSDQPKREVHDTQAPPNLINFMLKSWKPATIR